eukprot:6213631-Pleurochrysis_carterae.AAC.4
MRSGGLCVDLAAVRVPLGHVGANKAFGLGRHPVNPPCACTCVAYSRGSACLPVPRFMRCTFGQRPRCAHAPFGDKSSACWFQRRYCLQHRTIAYVFPVRPYGACAQDAPKGK